MRFVKNQNIGAQRDEENTFYQELKLTLTVNRSKDSKLFLKAQSVNRKMVENVNK